MQGVFQHINEVKANLKKGIVSDATQQMNQAVKLEVSENDKKIAARRFFVISVLFFKRNLLNEAETAVKKAMEFATRKELFSIYSLLLMKIYDRTGQFALVTQSGREIYDQVSKFKNINLFGRLNALIGKSNFFSGRYKKVEGYLNHAYCSFTKSQNKIGQRNVAEIFANYYTVTFDFKRARTNLAVLVKEYKGNVPNIIKILMNLSTLFCLNGYFNKSLKLLQYLDKSIETSNLEDRFSAHNLTNFMRIYLLTREHSLSLSCFDRISKFSMEKTPIEWQKVYYYLAENQISCSKFSEAEQNLLKAKEIIETKIQNQYDNVYVNFLLADVYIHHEKWNKAMGCLNEALRLNKGTNDNVNLAYIYVRYTHLSKVRSEYVKALDYAEYAVDSMKTVNSPFDHFSVYSELAEVLYSGKTTDHLKQKALELLEKAETYEQGLSVGSLILRNRVLKAEILASMEPVEASIILDRAMEEIKNRDGTSFFSDEIVTDFKKRAVRIGEIIKVETERLRELDLHHLHRVIKQTKEEEEHYDLRNFLEIIKERTCASRVILGLPHSDKIKDGGRIVLLGVDSLEGARIVGRLEAEEKVLGYTPLLLKDASELEKLGSIVSPGYRRSIMIYPLNLGLPKPGILYADRDYYKGGSSPFRRADLETLISLGRGIETLLKIRLSDLEKENTLLRDIAFGESGKFGIITQNPKMQQEIKKIEVLRTSKLPVLIYGESGTGKELFAKALHYTSGRRNCPFVPVNCSAIPSTLLEAELFGYSKGSFTGAQYDYEGLIPSANGGTLFLDEIGEMPLELQPKLLRVLEAGEVQSIGRRGSIKADFRLVTATNRILEQEVHEGRFREDLYYRIRGCEIKIPPLRERPEDIHLLAGYFLKMIVSSDKEYHGVSFSEKVLKIFYEYAWPGNIRELRSAVESSCLFRSKEKNVITEDSLPSFLHMVTAPATVTKDRGLSDRLIIDLYKMSKEKGYSEILKDLERGILLEALNNSRGNQRGAGKDIRINEATLRKKMQKLGIRSSKEDD